MIEKNNMEKIGIGLRIGEYGTVKSLEAAVSASKLLREEDSNFLCRNVGCKPS